MAWRDFRVPNQDAYVFAVHPKDPKIVYAGGRGDSLNLSRSTDASEPGGSTVLRKSWWSYWEKTQHGLSRQDSSPQPPPTRPQPPADPPAHVAAAGA